MLSVSSSILSMRQLQFATSSAWRRWLARNYNRESGVWVVFTKKGAKKPSMEYQAALDQALCYGWIDSIIRRIDDRRYARKFTPRRARSVWSEINRKRVAQLIRQQRMTAAGLQAVRRSKREGLWVAPKRPVVSKRAPREFLRALKDNPAAGAHFKGLAPGYQCRFIAWVAMAKRPQTRQARIRESIRLLGRKEKLGLK